MYSNEAAWCNGVSLETNHGVSLALIQLADKRTISPEQLKLTFNESVDSSSKKQMWQWWLEWYEDGWLKIDI
jgi:hypothetical protein